MDLLLRLRTHINFNLVLFFQKKNTRRVITTRGLTRAGRYHVVASYRTLHIELPYSTSHIDPRSTKGSPKLWNATSGRLNVLIFLKIELLKIELGAFQLREEIQ